MRLICLLLFFVVKAVLGSGSSAWASSNGFYIDISPPEFDTQVMFYVDVSQGEDLPAELQAQGSNDTIKAVWLCEDKQSEIAVGCLHFEIDYLFCFSESRSSSESTPSVHLSVQTQRFKGAIFV